MKNKNMKNCSKVLGGLFLLMLVLFVTVASAEDTGEISTTVASAGAQAVATGSETIASTQVTITSDGASATAIAKAKAENGGTATAIAEAWANWVDGSSAYARSIATVVAGIGETIWAEAKATASVSTDEASAETIAYVGTDPNYVDRDPNNGGDGGDPDNGKIVPVPTPRPDAIGGFIFGKGDIERYCNFKLQLTDENSDNDRRAKYFMNIIAWDYGFKEDKQFEDKYSIVCTSGMDMKDRIP